MTDEDSTGAVETDFDISMESLEDGPEEMDDPKGSPDPPESQSEDTPAGGSIVEKQGDSIEVPRKFRDAKDERNPVTFYIPEQVKQQIKSVRHEVEDEFGDARKLDVYAAVVECGSSNPRQVMNKMREWGYGKNIR